MAVKRVRKSEESVSMPVVDVQEKPRRNWKKWLWVVVIVGGIVAWWAKTKTWPIVAVVAGKPLTRYEVEQALYKQGGEGMVDSLITQRLIEAELDKKGVQIEESDLDARIEEMRATVPEGRTLEEELSGRGYSLEHVKKLVSLQMRLNKAVEPSASVSAEEITQYVKDNVKFLTGKTDEERKTEAGTILKQDKLSAAIESWVTEVKTNGQVWHWPY